MSVFRVDIEMCFKTEDDMVSFLNLLEKMEDKLAAKEEGQLPINRKVKYHECNHDTGGACGGYINVEINGTTEHKNKQGDIKYAEDVIPADTQEKIKAGLKAENEALKVENENLKKPKGEEI